MKLTGFYALFYYFPSTAGGTELIDYAQQPHLIKAEHHPTQNEPVLDLTYRSQQQQQQYEMVPRLALTDPTEAYALAEVAAAAGAAVAKPEEAPATPTSSAAMPSAPELQWP